MRWVVIPLVLLAAGTVALITGGGPDDGAAPAAETEFAVEPYIPPRLQIAQTAEKWAELFARAADAEDCRLMTQPLCERIACVGVGARPIRNCRPPTAAYRKSFAHAAVEDVATRGDHAGVRLSNGEALELIEVVEPEGRVWWVNRLGANVPRKYFDDVTPRG